MMPWTESLSNCIAEGSKETVKKEGDILQGGKQLTRKLEESLSLWGQGRDETVTRAASVTATPKC